MLVHVLNRHGEALMPCHPAKARLLLKEGKAKPVKGKTGYFTIQLLYGSSGYRQKIVVGIDTGAKRVPIAAVGTRKVSEGMTPLGKVYSTPHFQDKNRSEIRWKTQLIQSPPRRRER